MADDGDALGPSRTCSTTELQWLQEQRATEAAPPKRPSSKLEEAKPPQLPVLNGLEVPDRRPTHVTFYSTDAEDIHRASSLLLSSRMGTSHPSLADSSAAPGLPSAPPPSWWVCAATLAGPLAAPTLTLVAVAAGLFCVSGRPVARWYPALFASLSVAALGGLWVGFAWWLRRFLGRVAQGLQAILQAAEAEETGVLPAHRCVAFVVRQVYAATPMGQATVAVDQLDFVRPELEGMLDTPQGQVVINTTGVILWVNRSLCQFFGYQPAELLQENVRVLMPQPYAGQHDHFLRRHIRTGACVVLGGSREVPVLRRDGTQRIALLSVDDRVDTLDGANRLFFGTLDFHHQPEAVTLVQTKLSASPHIDLSAFHPLDAMKESMVAINARGVVLYCNQATTHLFRWKRAELVGSNVKILMAEPFASAHDGFLRRYVERDEGRELPGAPPASGIVGSGRDVMARDKFGQRVRVFLMVHRVDLLSGRAADCIFLAKLIHVVATDSTTQGSTGVSPRHKARSVAPSSTALRLAADSQLRLSPMKLHKCTVVLLQLRLPEDLVLEEQENPQQLRQLMQTFLDLVFHNCVSHRGVVYHVAGQSVAVLFNSPALNNPSHRSSAAAFMLQLTNSLSLHASLREVLEVQMAAVSSAVHSATCGTQEVMFGNILEVAATLLRVRQESQVTNPVMDGSLYEELQYSYTCRLVNRLVTFPDEPSDRLVEVFELLSLKETAEDEWMYQLGADEGKGASWAHWRQAWAHLPAPLTSSSPASLKGRLSQPCSPANAREALQLHLALWPQDTPGLVLLRALGDVALAVGAPGRVQYCGTTPFQLQFGPAPDTRAPADGGLGVPNHSFARSVRQTSDIILSNVSEDGEVAEENT